MIFHYIFFLLDKDTCLQKTVRGHCCKLPFVYDGKNYTSCTKDCAKGVLSWCLGWENLRAYYWCYYDEGYKKFEKCKGKQNDGN